MTGSIENQPYNPEISAPVAAAEPFSWAGLIVIVITFLLILFAAFWLIKKLNRYSLRTLESPWARVIDRQVLSGQQSLYLVEIAGKLQILGVSDHHIIKVAEINDPDVAAEILEEIATRPEEKADRFFETIRKTMRKRKHKDAFSTELKRSLEEVKR